MGMAEEDVTSLFSSTFAAFYLGLEVSLKVVGSLVSRFGSKSSIYTIYAIYSIIAVSTTFLMTAVRDMIPETQVGAAQGQQLCAKMSSALLLLVKNPKCTLMVPTNVAFGFASAFINSYIQARFNPPTEH